LRGPGSLFPDGKPLVVPSADPAANYYSLGDGTVPLFSPYPSQLGAVVSFFQPARSGEHSGLIGTYKCDIVSFLLGNVSCPASAPALAAASAAGTLSVAVAGRPRPYLSAPGGAASGIDPATGARETGIAGSSVTMQADSSVITVPDSADGTYSVALSSAYPEDYELQLTYLAEGASESTEVTAYYSGPATINFTFSSVGSPKINILHGPAPPTGLQAEAFSSGGRQTRPGILHGRALPAGGYPLGRGPHGRTCPAEWSDPPVRSRWDLRDPPPPQGRSR
jgi:hypothetical protein